MAFPACDVVTDDRTTLKPYEIGVPWEEKPPGNQKKTPSTKIITAMETLKLFRRARSPFDVTTALYHTLSLYKPSIWLVQSITTHSFSK